MSNEEKSDAVKSPCVDMDTDKMASVMRALANSNRLRIFILLQNSERSGGPGSGLRVGEIAESLEIGQSTISHHLKELEHVGLIRLERRGKGVYCSASDHALRDVFDCIECR